MATKQKPITSTIQPPVRRPRVVRPKVKKLVNRIVFVLDASGSMGWLSHKVVSMYNSWIDRLKQESNDKGQETYISRIDFDTSAVVVEKNTPIGKAKHMTRFNTGGGTALFDGLFKAIEAVEPYEDDENTSMLIINITDGDENSSSDTNVRNAGKTMLRKMKQKNWSFTYMLPPGRKNSFCSAYSVPTDNAIEWEASERGADIAESVTSRAISGYYGSRAKGMTQSMSFYSQSDASNIAPKDLKSSLTNIASQCQSFDVPKETDISSFVTLKTKQPYQTGKAFYQLTKREEVQPRKEVLIQEKGKSAIYAGTEAREMIGLHNGATDYVTPGNHANYDIFVQSTSHNRKLVRGTKVIVRN